MAGCFFMLKVIVIGAPRSGTSLVASIVNELGFTIEHRGATESEPGGQWGGVDVKQIVSAPLFTDKRARVYFRRYKSMGIKIHGFDRRYMEDYIIGNYDFKVVLTNRKTENVLRSLTQKRMVENKAFSREKARVFAGRRFKSARLKVERFITQCEEKGKTVLPITMEKLIENPVMHVMRLAAFLGVDDRAKIVSSIALVNPEYWHHK